MIQSQALKILKSGENIFLTGSAGTGKTFLLNKFINYLRKKKINVGITASTGIAATHLDGRTIHSWSGIGLKKEMDDKSIRRLIQRKYLRDRIQKTEVLIIDEISMLDAERLDLIDRVYKNFRHSNLPFGGIQMIMSGDFFQLPPIGRGEETKFAYESSAWNEANIKVCYLTKQFRHKDNKFIHILNKIRTNEAGEKELLLLKERLNETIKGFSKPTKLYTHNTNVDAVNSYELSKINEKQTVYNMSSSGSSNLVKVLKKSCLAPEKLRLKVGAVVMFVKNNFDAGYVNGTLGKIISYNRGRPVVKTKSGLEIIVSPTKWNIEEEGEITASITQFPLRLAWAITVHKSQGMSLDVAEIDLSKAFEYGMGYVALSRVRTLDGIKLIGINEMSLTVNPKVVKKDKEFREVSK